MTHASPKLCITGATGFIGRHTLQPLLEKGYEVHALSRVASGTLLSHERLHWHNIDIFNHAAIAAFCKEVRPSHLLHLAWITTHGYYWDAPENQDWLEASKHLITHFSNNGGKRVVVTGTCAEYDWGDASVEGGVLHEDTPCNPQTAYGKAKHELYTWLAEQSSISTLWARLFWLFGPYEDPRRLIASLITGALHGQEIALKQPHVARDYMYSVDVGRILALLLISNATNAMNIGMHQATQLGDIKHSINTLLGVSALHDTEEEQSLNTSHEPDVICADNRSLLDVLGPALYTPMDQALKETINWWKEAEAVAS